MTRLARIALVGPPASGKATVGPFLSKALGVALISLDTVLGESIRAGDPHRLAERTANREPVPAQVLNDVVLPRLDPDGFVLDGYPRTAEQARALDDRLEQADTRLDLVLELMVPDEVVSARLSRDIRMEDRTDDSPETVAARLVTYHREAAPLLAHYRGRVRRVSATGDIDEVCQRAKAAVGTAPAPRA